MSDPARRSRFPFLPGALLVQGWLFLGVGACHGIPLDPARLADAGKDTEGETVVECGVHSLPWTDEIPYAPRLDGELGGRFVSVRGARLYVIEEGQGTPLVLLNGGPGNSLHSFVPHFSRAAGFARVIYYDPRGVGRSEWKSEEGYSVRQALSDLEALREQLGIESWVVLGWSWGGHLARLYSLCYLERVRGLVLLSAAADIEAHRRERRPNHHTVAEAKRIRACYTFEGRRVSPFHTDAVPLSHVQLMVYNALANGDWKRQHFNRPSQECMSQIALYEWVHDANYNGAMRLSGDIPLKGAFVGTPFETLIVDGRWDMTYPPDKGMLLAKEIEGGRHMLLEDSSHHAFSEEPERFFRLLEDFLSELPLPDPQRSRAWTQRVSPWVEKIMGRENA